MEQVKQRQYAFLRLFSHLIPDMQLLLELMSSKTLIKYVKSSDFLVNMQLLMKR